MLRGLLRVADKRLLCFLICGSVDEGKSTLIGHLPHDRGLLRDDELAALAADVLRDNRRLSRCGAARAPANRPSPISSSSRCIGLGITPCCSTATSVTGLSRDLGFSDRGKGGEHPPHHGAGEADGGSGLIASVSPISPFRSERHCPARSSRKKRSAVSDFSLNPSSSSWLAQLLEPYPLNGERKL